MSAAGASSGRVIPRYDEANARYIAVNNFDKASQDWGWESDQGSGERVNISKTKYEEEKKVLLSLIDSI